jgi:hypothetical protein
MSKTKSGLSSRALSTTGPDIPTLTQGPRKIAAWFLIQVNGMVRDSDIEARVAEFEQQAGG